MSITRINSKAVAAVVAVTAIVILFAAKSVLASTDLLVGAEYQINVEAVKSIGTVTSTANNNSLGLNTTAIAGSNGKLSFSLSGIPTSSSYNFLVVTIKNSSGTTVRRSIVPAPAPGSTLSLGVSPITDNQTKAFLSAFQNAGTDDPLLAFFGFMMIRSADVSTSEITQMAQFCIKGIKGTDGTGLTTGFEASLRDQGATSAMLTSLRSNLVTNFTNLTSLYKDSVDQYFSSGADAEKEKRGEAAAKIFEYLVNATNDAGMKVEWLIMAFNDLGAIVCPLITQAVNSGSVRTSTAGAMDSVISRGLQKLRADNFLKKYTNALTALGASTAEINQYTTAANTLMNTMQQNFQNFEKNVMGDEMPDADVVNEKNNEMNTAMEAAFNQFMTDCQATDARIVSLRASLKQALWYNDTQMDQYLPASRFKFYNSSGNAVNWSIMQVVSVSWLADLITAGGSLSYARDDTSVPSMMQWMGQCSNTQYWDQQSCLSNAGIWTTGRRDYTAIFPGDSGSQMWAALEGLREDIQVAEFTRWNSFSGIDFNDKAGAMEAMKLAEKAFYDKLFNSTGGANSLINDITGTTNGTTAIAVTAKKALITIFLSPDF
ncbi:MAG: hypothetical protein KJ893_06140 [Candidatus Omnitrophica bacterium]|nr:hypothetical protein [Candidatus Omnitrophota bacterium]MBU4478121.1 hypothetical protein [Candidatus Omnitrophota bacterium]MCG2704040.1 hypothetical protein [Candidatus Omnitrophota bacterium]